MTKRHKARLSPRVAMQKLIAEREQGPRAVDRPLKSPQSPRARLKKPAFMRNPKLKPRFRNGRVQKAARMALYGLIEASTSEITSWTFATRANTYRALRQVAVPIGRSKTGSGRPVIWRLR